MTDLVFHEHFGFTAATLKWACIGPVTFLGALFYQVVLILIGTIMKKMILIF